MTCLSLHPFFSVSLGNIFGTVVNLRLEVELAGLLVNSFSQLSLLDFELDPCHIHCLKILLDLGDFMDLQEQVSMLIERSKAVSFQLLQHLLIFVQGWLNESPKNCEQQDPQVVQSHMAFDLSS
mmetsp:Transcript_22803/g.22020  ORF Transcript_22803/g.22020 Transcript_22803/m.22020 type:complete len:124 (+) Transcript_22803:70-441(+)